MSGDQLVYGHPHRENVVSDFLIVCGERLSYEGNAHTLGVVICIIYSFTIVRVVCACVCVCV